MREILFRGKRKDNGKWVHGTLNNVLDEVPRIQYAVIEHGMMFLADFDVIPETVGQYTGLKDLHGTRIFEGDIIRHHYKNLASNGYTSDKGVVKWDCKECFFYRTSLSGKDKTISADCIYEIIGNVYDNQELLKGE